MSELMTVLVVALKIIVVIGAGCGLFYLAKQIPWPTPLGNWALLVVGLILLVLVIWLILTWGFGVAMPA